MHYFTLTRLLPLALLAVSAHTAATKYTPPSQRGVPGSTSVSMPNVTTDARMIADTAGVVDQKSGVGLSVPPNQPVANTSVTAVDGQVLANGTSTTAGSMSSRAVERVGKRGGYSQVFAGTGMRNTDRDASVDGTAYLTYTLVSNATYDVDACFAFCDRVPGCVFVNLYYEFNNPLLDFVFTERSNLKCAAYGDVHYAIEKTNFGGQQLEAPPAPQVYIQHSSGWAVSAVEIAVAHVPDGYELVFGPTDGANNAPGYMGFAFIDKYDVSACAALCNARDPDEMGGACQYFNIWRALVDGIPTTYTCAFYYLVADESTAVNYGQGNLRVTWSCGYKRTSFALDGGFESYACNGTNFCFAASSATWIGSSPYGGSLDASIFHYAPYARSGSSVGLLGSASGVDTLSGTLSPQAALKTVAGKKYVVTFFANTLYAGCEAEKEACMEVVWNGSPVRRVELECRDWTYYQTVVVASGKDMLALRGGSAPAWIFIDDVRVFKL
ncbi:hypothetical protein E4T56_gene13229 [Termitomyces sp. T112]|nr:hypothetical protein C0989_000171 [Termitomyces sp. Mn162]KAG5721498.1 hypothetical protein E4T56_gene13229 [Termitomyces sp. T112]KAH0586473.1 hypothetical protein H2248_007704 [Termitomyces sp. 'cryptogamus']